MTVTLPLPPPLNAVYRTRPGAHGLYKTQEAKAWEEEAQWVAKMARDDSTPWEGPVEMVVRTYLKKDRDIDGSLKILLDCFQDIVYVKDSQVTKLTVTKQQDAANPRLEVTIVSSGT